jgi:hypothetical protein
MSDDKITLAPGTYRLTCDVTNPEPDRRVKGDWRKAPVIPAGKIFRMLSRGDRSYPVLVPVGDRYWILHDLNVGSQFCAPLVNAIVPNLEPIEQTHAAWFDEEQIEDRFARWLVTSGRMTREELLAIWNVYDAEPI